MSGVVTWVDYLNQYCDLDFFVFVCGITYWIALTTDGDGCSDLGFQLPVLRTDGPRRSSLLPTDQGKVWYVVTQLISVVVVGQDDE